VDASLRAGMQFAGFDLCFFVSALGQSLFTLFVTLVSCPVVDFFRTLFLNSVWFVWLSFFSHSPFDFMAAFFAFLSTLSCNLQSQCEGVQWNFEFSVSIKAS